jgi:4'-phosphopantetheinyl transferase EntD
VSNEQLDAALRGSLQSIVPPGVLLGHHVIGPGDGDALLPVEQDDFIHCVEKVRRQSGAARIAARGLLAVWGYQNVALPRSRRGAPVWPSGIIGSLAHDDEVAVAAIASVDRFSALGIDVEPAAPLPRELVNLVATPAERLSYATAVLELRLLFVVKEAIFKALNPLDGVFLDFHDIEVDLHAKQAQTRTGQLIGLAFTTSPRVLAIAFR